MHDYDGFLTGEWCFVANGSRLWQHSDVDTLFHHALTWVWDHPRVWDATHTIQGNGVIKHLTLCMEYGRLWSVEFEGKRYRVVNGAVEHLYGCWRRWYP